jgi:hypothetical protein
MFAGDSTYSVAAESAAFKKLHNLNVAITQLKAQGNEYGVQQLLPYYRQALEEYRRSGATDPDYLTRAEEFIVSLGSVGSGTVRALDAISKRLILGGIVIAAIMFLRKR